jgi:hypothetical protein
MARISPADLEASGGVEPEHPSPLAKTFAVLETAVPRKTEPNRPRIVRDGEPAERKDLDFSDEDLITEYESAIRRNRDESFVQQLATTFQIPLHIKRFDTSNYASKNKLSIIS